MPANGERVRALWSAYEQGGLDAACDLADDDVVLALASAPGRVIRGRGALGEHLAALATAGTEVRARVDEVEDLGDIVLVRGSLRIERWGSLSESTMVWRHRVEDGRVREVVAFHSRREALATLR